MKRIIICSCLLSLAPMLAVADAPPPPPQGVWTGSGQLGYLSSQGNSDAKSANASIDLALVEDPWTHAFHLGGLYGQSAGIVAAERWDSGWQSNYDLTKDLYVFGALRYQHDMFSGFQYQASGAGGVGYKILATDDVKLSVQLGAGYRVLRPEELTKNDTGAVIARTLLPSEKGAVATAGLIYEQKLTGSTTLSDKLVVETGSSDTLITNALAITVKMSTTLSLAAGYAIQDNSKPPAGLKKLDTLETLSLVYSIR